MIVFCWRSCYSKMVKAKSSPFMQYCHLKGDIMLAPIFLLTWWYNRRWRGQHHAWPPFSPLPQKAPDTPFSRTGWPGPLFFRARTPLPSFFAIRDECTNCAITQTAHSWCRICIQSLLIRGDRGLDYSSCSNSSIGPHRQPSGHIKCDKSKYILLAQLNEGIMSINHNTKRLVRVLTGL